MVKKMKKKIIELPLVAPIYSTYHNQGSASAVISDNLSIRNWYLNEVMILQCTREFLSGYTSPKLDIVDSSLDSNPNLEKNWYYLKNLGKYTNPIIRNLIDDGYYIYFYGADDYYIKGKTWYKDRHFIHDGLICGYNQEEETFCIYAYDSNWIYRKFWCPQKSFTTGVKAALGQDISSHICPVKPSQKLIEFDTRLVIKKLKEYLNPSLDICPKDEVGTVCGIAVQDYIVMYVNQLYNGKIPYERMDRRIFRLLWEHKKVMLERLEKMEKDLKLDCKTSTNYRKIVSEADKMRMLYASHHIRRRDSLLPIICKSLTELSKKEREILEDFLLKAEEKII